MVAARDKADSKVTNFTPPAEGVLTVDNSDLNFGETLDVLVRIVDDAIEERNTASTFPTSKAMSWMKAMRS